MPHIVSVWLPNWPIRRFRRASLAGPGEPPLVLATTGPGPRLAAVDEAAHTLGLKPGEALADARARIGQELRVEPVDPQADAAALGKLALWATRYTPVVAPFGEADGADGLFLDVTGAAHLVGGEAALCEDIARRLKAFGLPSRTAMAATPGLAWALARYAHLPPHARGGEGQGGGHLRLATVQGRAWRNGASPDATATPSARPPTLFLHTTNLSDSHVAPGMAKTDREGATVSLSRMGEGRGEGARTIVGSQRRHHTHVASHPGRAPPHPCPSPTRERGPAPNGPSLFTKEDDPPTLPIAALRLPAETQIALKRLGFRRVGQVMEAARAPLARRFGDGLLTRLDQMTGRRPEPLVSVRPPPVYAAVRQLLDPVTRQDTVVAHARRLMAELGAELERADVGARRLRLSLYRVDGHVTALEFGLAAPSRSPDHLARLLRLRLDRPGEGISSGFGFETLRLEAVAVGPLEPQGRGFDGPRPADLAARLADALAQRLDRHVARLEPTASHCPERSVARVGVEAAPAPDWTSPAAAPRPLVLFRRAEPVEDVLAAVPDGPPQRFRWRGRLHRVAHAQGPERISPEWWRGEGRLRDYYVVEDAAARRLWLYREGLYDEGPPRWYVHGLFA